MFIDIRPSIFRFSRKPEIAAGLHEQTLIKDWQDIVGSIKKSARDKSEALYVNDMGELVVRVRDHLWLQEFAFFKNEIEVEISKNTKIKSVRLIT